MPRFCSASTNRPRSAAQKAQLAALPMHLSSHGSSNASNNGGNTIIPTNSTKMHDYMSPKAHISNIIQNATRRERWAKSQVKTLRAKILVLNSTSKTKLARLEHVLGDLGATRIALFKAEESNQLLGMELTSTRLKNVALGNTLATLQNEASGYAKAAAKMSLRVQTHQLIKKQLQKRINSLQRNHDALRKRIKRAPMQKACATARLVESKTSAAKNQMLKDTCGVILPEIRDMLRELAGLRVSTERMLPVICCVTRTFGLAVVDTVSSRSVSRIVLEGLVQAQMQIAYEIKNTTYLSICGDGTGIKNQQHEARLIRMPVPTYGCDKPPPELQCALAPPPLRSLGVQKASNHTAHSQLEGWKKTIGTCCDIFNRSPLGENSNLSLQVFAQKTRGILTDHASDQKLLAKILEAWMVNCDRELRGKAILDAMTEDERIQALSEHLDVACHAIGSWDTLSVDQQNDVTHNAWLTLALTTGDTAFQALSEDEKKDALFVVWTGCCMHKELNAVKGGAKAMAAAWSRHKLPPPIALQNKFEIGKANTAESSAGTSQRRKQESSQGGVKLTSLAGAILNNKNDKVGQQDTYKHYFEKQIGFRLTFPDTSNTRYGSHGDAAIELVVNRDTYLRFFQRVHDAKNAPGFTNIELNVFQGLQDQPTLTELAVLGLYAQAVGRPYMSHVRGTVENALALGDFHERVKAHCRKVITNPDLLLASDASPKTGALEGDSWDRPDFMYHVVRMRSLMPNLPEMLVAFFEGALETWVRFTSEFAPDSTISQATSEQRASVWNSATNDASEGALGQCRQDLRRAPFITDNQRNARVMWKQNDTRGFAENILSEQDHQFVRKEARRIDASGASQKMRLEQNEVWENRAEANQAKQVKTSKRKAATRSKLAVVKVLDGASVEELMKLRVVDLDAQIDKLRELGDKAVPAKSTIGKKEAKALVIFEALCRHQSRAADLERRLEGEEVGRSSSDTEKCEDQSEADQYPDEQMDLDPEWEY